MGKITEQKWSCGTEFFKKNLGLTVYRHRPKKEEEQKQPAKLFFQGITTVQTTCIYIYILNKILYEYAYIVYNLLNIVKYIYIYMFILYVPTMYIYI